MIKTVLKYIFYFLLLCCLLVVFLPKKNLYYLGLDTIKTYKVSLLSNDIQDNYLSFDIKNLTINYDSIKVAEISDVSISTYFYTSKIEINNVIANDVLKNFIPEYVKKLVIEHNIFKNPTQVSIESFFAKGRAFGTINLLEKKIVLNLDVPNSFIRKYKDITRKFKKNGKYYTYEYKY